MRDMLSVDWSSIPAPEDDGAARHLRGLPVPGLLLPCTSGEAIDLSTLSGRTVVYVYPRTGRPDLPLLEGWNMTPGARGCTPQSCAFRDLAEELAAAGADNLFGLSTQDSAYQREAVERLHLPFALLSDAQGQLTEALALPMFELNATRFLKRLTLILNAGQIEEVFYPVFPPDQNARQVLAWLQGQRQG
ncbi:peroxiredoxin [Pseudomonas sp. LD120]|uniref:peroxiredoxin n=1 Tax=Pseudomonas sp. LD120 TaxID=485751 RepID=UPI0013582467|nr:peroxiredoxin [Pseudomonas sp. LD120]KAF0865505.1 redoxin family protein [Pseudomonas sp. LD120]